MIDIATEGARLALYTAKKLNIYERLIAALRKKHRVLVLGATGVGKTSLIQSLTEWMPEAISYMNRTARAAKSRIKIKDEHFEFIDTPGQEEHAPIRTSAIDSSLKTGVSGVLNVVSYGYHEYRRPIDGVFNSNGTVNKSYLQRHRQLEIEMIREWASRLVTHQVNPWVMTVISKADFWWPARHSVYDHYSTLTEEYCQSLSVVPQLQHSVHEYCSTIHKFYGQKTPPANFDRTDVRHLKAAFLADIIDAIGRI